MLPMDRAELLQPLGFQRLRILGCLGGDLPHAAGYFEPDPAVDIFVSFHHHVRELSQQWGNLTDHPTRSLLAAARLLTGDLTAAQEIVDCFPAAAPRLDHGAGDCLVAPFHALSETLPLPSAWKNTTRWLAGSAAQAYLQDWLAENSPRLRWIERAGVYELEESAQTRASP